MPNLASWSVRTIWFLWGGTDSKLIIKLVTAIDLTCELNTVPFRWPLEGPPWENSRYNRGREQSTFLNLDWCWINHSKASLWYLEEVQWGQIWIVSVFLLHVKYFLINGTTSSALFECILVHIYIYVRVCLVLTFCAMSAHQIKVLDYVVIWAVINMDVWWYQIIKPMK